MVGIELLRHGGNVVDGGPDRGVVSVSESLHLVSDCPDQKRGVVSIAKDGFLCPFVLLGHSIRIVVVEAVSLVPEPDPDRDRDPVSMRLVEELVDPIGAPGPSRVRARRGQALERVGTARSLDSVRLPAAEQLRAIGRLGELDLDRSRLGLGSGDGNGQRQGERDADRSPVGSREIRSGAWAHLKRLSHPSLR